MDYTECEYVEAGTVLTINLSRPYKQIEIYSKIGNTQFYSHCNSSQKQKSESRRIISRKRKESSDDEYNVKTQKKDRNVTSNLIHHLVKFTRLIKGPKQRVIRIIQYKNFNISYERFCSILQDLSANLKTYVTIKHIKNLWFDNDEQKKQFCIIMRVLSRIFYKKNGFLSVYYSNKFNKSSKNVHLKGLRMLVQMIAKGDPQQFHTTVINY